MSEAAPSPLVAIVAEAIEKAARKVTAERYLLDRTKREPFADYERRGWLASADAAVLVIHQALAASGNKRAAMLKRLIDQRADAP